MNEEIGLHLVFEERRVRGSNNVQCCVYVSDDGTNDIELSEHHSAPSWEAFKKEYPTLDSILYECSRSPYWAVYGKHDVRDLRIVTIEGHEGLYEYDGEVVHRCKPR